MGREARRNKQFREQQGTPQPKPEQQGTRQPKKQRQSECDEFAESFVWGDDDMPVPRSEAPAPDKWELGAEPSPDARGGSAWQSAQMGTVHDVAGVFRVHWKTVERWRLRDGLPCLRHRGVIRYDLSDVLRWASARKEGV